MNKAYKITVIGAGARGNVHMQMLKKYHETDAIISGICDVSDERLEKARTDYVVEALFSDYEQAIVQTKPDIVIVATPAYYHCDIASFAMDNGCHVLVEKPFDLSLEKCFKLKEKQKETGKSLAIGLQYRNKPSSRIMKHLMAQRLLGKNVVMSFTDVRENRPKIAMHDARFGNGGPMTDMACHYFDLMRWYYNSNPKSVSALWRINAVECPNLKAIETKAPDSCIITVEYESGDMGNMVMTWGLPTGNGISFSEFMAIGSEGFVVMPKGTKLGEGLKMVSAGKEITVNTNPNKEQDIKNPELAVYDHLVSEIEGRGNVQASFDEGIQSLASSMAAIKSGVLGRPVSISEILDKKPTILDCMLKEGKNDIFGV